jgi:hypothetical protein
VSGPPITITNPQFAAAFFPISPPTAALAYVDPKTGCWSQVGFRLMTDIVASIDGIGGLQPSVEIIANLSGDGTLSVTGVLTVFSSQGRVFVESAFTDTTDASNITTGTLSNSVLPAPLDDILSIGVGLLISGGALEAEAAIVTTVAGLPSPTTGRRRFVSDSTVVAAGNFGNAVAGGGANKVPVYADGSAWFIG